MKNNLLQIIDEKTLRTGIIENTRDFKKKNAT